jgi:hypothetical protein
VILSVLEYLFGVDRVGFDEFRWVGYVSMSSDVVPVGFVSFRRFRWLSSNI